MSNYWICHQPLHVANKRECTITPYGGMECYDAACHPFRLTLVGLSETNSEDLGEPSDLEICVNLKHYSNSMTCTKQPREKRSYFKNSNGHKFVPFYAKGQYVVIQAKVASDVSAMYPNTVAIEGDIASFRMKNENVLGLIDGPVPMEPEHHLMLKSKQNGLVFYFNDAWREAPAANSQPHTWEDLYRLYGPFIILTPQGEI